MTARAVALLLAVALLAGCGEPDPPGRRVGERVLLVGDTITARPTTAILRTAAEVHAFAQQVKTDAGPLSEALRKGVLLAFVLGGRCDPATDAKLWVDGSTYTARAIWPNDDDKNCARQVTALAVFAVPTVPANASLTTAK